MTVGVEGRRDGRRGKGSRRNEGGRECGRRKKGKSLWNILEKRRKREWRKNGGE